jgi:hypothetical protein
MNFYYQPESLVSDLLHKERRGLSARSEPSVARF